jgi:purine-nucleoside phosphorylase
MSQLHLHANPGEVADVALLPGDPQRARWIAETYLSDVVAINEHRLLLGFTGRYRGTRITVQATGMGCPSLAIVAEEAIRLGARTLIRVGTAGVIADGIAPGDLIVATAAVANDGTTRQYLQGAAHASVADFTVTRALVDAGARKGGSGALHVGLIQTEDAFYATTPSDVAALAARGVLAIEMEASALFLLGALRRVRTGCIVVGSNRIGDAAMIAPQVLRRGVAEMTEIALDAALALHAQATEEA